MLLLAVGLQKKIIFEGSPHPWAHRVHPLQRGYLLFPLPQSWNLPKQVLFLFKINQLFSIFSQLTQVLNPVKKVENTVDIRATLIEYPFKNIKKYSQPAGFEPARGDPIRFQVWRLNHSATTARFWLSSKKGNAFQTGRNLNFANSQPRIRPASKNWKIYLRNEWP